MRFPEALSGKQPVQEVPGFIGNFANFAPVILSTPESGHVQCARLCLLWAKSEHRVDYEV